MEDRRLASRSGDHAVVIAAHDDVAQHEQGYTGVLLGVPYLVWRKQDFVRIAGRALDLDVPLPAVNLDHIIEALGPGGIDDLAESAVVDHSRVHRMRLDFDL